jgi:hypothetical protein
MIAGSFEDKVANVQGALDPKEKALRDGHSRSLLPLGLAREGLIAVVLRCCGLRAGNGKGAVVVQISASGADWCVLYNNRDD